MKNALLGIERAEAILPLDPEMASFRLITAQEEIATALFKALQWQRYPNAELLNSQDHQHKAAVAPFLVAVGNAIAEGPVKNLNLAFSAKQRRFEAKFRITELGLENPEGQDLAFQVANPLDFNIGRGVEERLDFFERQLEDLAQSGGFEQFFTFVADAKNQRNQLLYASDSGLPTARVTAAGIQFATDGILGTLMIIVMILQTEDHQRLVVQALQSFLTCLKRSVSVAITYSEFTPEVLVHVTQTGKGTVQFAPRNDPSHENTGS